ncbi:acyl-CoA dehydrogenase [Lutibaculum baratangense]|uniref:3-methylmercaptopropionyl-CoA dehydrogenase n=1 Tax=Lutibaculum baratangense AMV1 TaxID=631454 RepID=V4TEY2_9HYPH|nr:acyl-CoA dehydrogenase [Lutibaculum baratangense]ESR24753.1 Acyl-CoA dehydrogenase [Lutibaculum baratangense AMV1]
MSFRVPVQEISHALRHGAGLDKMISRGLFPDLSDDLVEAVLEEAGRFASEEIAPLNRIGDQHGTPFENGVVRTPPGWKEAYQGWVDGGWMGLSASPEHGGQGLPLMLFAATTEMWNQASMAFGIGPVLTVGAIEALATHGSPHLNKTYLPRLVSGEWAGTMNLTEPQAGSDLALLRTKAERRDDGTYLIRGQKIYITYGEHDLTDNIVHLVLARLPDAPEGTRGISLFLVPKYLPDGEGRFSIRNDLRCTGVEHKLGIHGSPTCTMSYGEGEGAVGYLVGEENRGLNCMFTMMNNARLAVGLQGVAIAERAYQQALAYARERRQGKAPGAAGGEPSPIILHPDVRRNLLTMKALTGAARIICYETAHALDIARHGSDDEERRVAQERANLLTPVAKAFSTDVGVEVASLGVQVHGGMGFIEETGAAQHLRDARIAPIYEGTNGIQAIDLVTRKLGQSDGEAVRSYIAEMRETVARLGTSDLPGLGEAGERLAAAIDALERATLWITEHASLDPAQVLASATPYLRLFGIAAGGAGLARGALAAAEAGAEGARAQIELTRFFAEAIAPEAGALAQIVTGGAEATLAADAALA